MAQTLGLGASLPLPKSARAHRRLFDGLGRVTGEIEQNGPADVTSPNHPK